MRWEKDLLLSDMHCNAKKRRMFGERRTDSSTPQHEVFEEGMRAFAPGPPGANGVHRSHGEVW